MKIDQIAFYARSVEQIVEIKTMFGLLDAKWIEDQVTAKSLFRDGKWCVNKANLLFNYDLGIELEVLSYVDGDHWHINNPLHITKLHEAPQPFISHVGIHLADGEAFPEMVGYKLVQETFTFNHMGEYFGVGQPGHGRTYHYKIFEFTPGSYIKYIKRIQSK